MKKTVRRTLATVLFAILSVCLIFTVAMQTTANDVFADEAEGYNMYDIHQAGWPNSTYSTYLDVGEDTDDGGDTYYGVNCTQTMAASEGAAGGSFILRNPYMYYEKDATYNVSFKIKTVADEEISNTWRMTARAVIDGAIQFPTVTNANMIRGKYEDWTEINFAFKASTTSTDASNGKNCFDLCFAGLVEGDMVMIKDVKVLAPKSIVERTNLFTGEYKFTNPNHAKMMTNEEVTVEGFSKVNKISMLETGEKVSALITRASFAWQDNVKYHVSFFYKTEGSFDGTYCMIRSKGKANVTASTPYYANSAGFKVNDGQWKMFNCNFDKSTLSDDGTKNDNCFDFFLSIGPNESIYIADFRISALPCEVHTAEVEYVWNNDNTKCTASYKACSVCGVTPTDTETVDAVASADTATCTEGGKITYTATFTNSAFETQTKDVNTEAKGHAYGEVTYTWANENSTCTATKCCTASGCEEKITETVNATSEDETDKTVYTATFTNSAFTVQTKEVKKEVTPEPSPKTDEEPEKKDEPTPETKEEPKEEKGGCSGSVGASSMVVLLTMATACIVVALRKREEK